MESDIAVLRELCGSVYLTTVQKQALGRLLSQARRDAPRKELAGGRDALQTALAGREERRTLPAPTRLPACPSSSAVEEDRRHALLGPCGAE